MFRDPMSWSIPVFRLFGIQVKVHIFFIVIAIGLFLSTLTRNQIVAGTLTFGVLLGLWILGWLDDPAAGALTRAIAYLGLLTHLEELMKGVLDLKDIVFYLTVTFFGLFLAHQSVESQRWRA